ncbi:sensor domain-containing diguanylate cyclase [Pseudothauera lacus]|uniref:diguanylate cyclase n=1 Tax=Pseudothauera lacus TaxID=2136175 RepID=A0A2T4IDA4_9RHOO|nr:diguanylate cyclase [Pseudothauera lacus]PTD95764.1 hypothetical protein C8261_12230 [Pseudothauera lacus]
MASAQRQFEHSLIEAIHEASPDGILVVDQAGTVVSFNQRFLDIFRLTLGAPEVATGAIHDRLLLDQALRLIKDPEAFLARVEALYADPTLHDVSEIALNDDRTLERHSTALWDEQQRYLGRVWFFRDISERKRYEHLLEAQSNRDPLTGVANRRCFFKRAQEEFARARRTGMALSVIMIDIDRFKRINDRRGHASGDEVLRHLCDSARVLMRESDLLARLGGEEFAILAPDTTVDGAVLLAERLRQHITAQPVVCGDGPVSYTISAGIGMLDATDASIEGVLRRADNALYAAKRAGRNRAMAEQGSSFSIPPATR